MARLSLSLGLIVVWFSPLGELTLVLAYCSLGPLCFFLFFSLMFGILQ